VIRRATDFNQWSVRNLIEIATQIRVDHVRVPSIDQAVHGLDRVLRTHASAVRMLFRLQIGFEDGLKHQHRLPSEQPGRVSSRSRRAKILIRGSDLFDRRPEPR
jgi:hypothetical protein